jgi:phosphoadenosine phosphosulfate reductase
MVKYDNAGSGPGSEPGFVTRLARRYAGLQGKALLRPLINIEFRHEIALVSSFGADSAVLLHMVSQISPDLPVYFLDTVKHFPETLTYRHELVERLGLRDVRDIAPDAAELGRFDPQGSLHARDQDACCQLRKVNPLERAMAGIEARISGRKRFQSKDRRSMTTIGWSGDHVSVNPLAGWTAEAIKTYILDHELPRHPLIANGFASIGCAPCTTAVRPGEDMRAGRWRNNEKTECGIHMGANGRWVQTQPAGC